MGMKERHLRSLFSSYFPIRFAGAGLLADAAVLYGQPLARAGHWASGQSGGAISVPGHRRSLSVATGTGWSGASGRGGGT